MNPADNDTRFDRQLEDYIGWRSSHAPGAPDLATMTTRVSAAVDMRAKQRSTTLRALAIAAALAALAMLAVGGALVGGAMRLDPLRADAPLTAATSSPHSVNGSTRASNRPTPNPTPTTPAVTSEAFASPVYGYSIQPPEGWEVAPATAAWDGTGPWGASEADIATPASPMPGRRLTIVSTRLPAGMTTDAWIDANTESLPSEFKSEGGHQHCVFVASGTGTMTTEGAIVSVTDGVIDGRPASIRTVCGHITGTVIVDDRVYQFSLFVDRRPNGDRALFDAVMATVDFDPQAPAVASGSIVSPKYGYTLDLPDGWELTAPATSAWTRQGPWAPGEADRYTRTGITRTLEIAARDVPAGMSDIDFVGQYVPRRGGADDSPHCSYNGGPITGPLIGGPSPVWIEVRPEPRRTLVRATCSAMDGVVFVDGTAYVLQLAQSDMQLWIFDELLAALSFDVPPVTFTSPRHGYSIELASDWQVAPGTREWTWPGRPAGGMSDAFIDPRAVARFTIAAHTKPAETSEDRYVADAAPLPANVRLDGPEVRCVFGDMVVERGPIPPWQAEVIGGHPARVRSMCGTVDAVVFVGDRGYLFTLISGSGTTGDLERFRHLVASVRFDDGRTTFVSDGYGYSVRYPGDWQVTPASTPWDGTDTSDDGMDRFASSASGPTAHFTVAARAAPGPLKEEAWIAATVPPVETSSGRCANGVVMPKPDLEWHQATIDGRLASVRSACSIVDGVVLADGLGYWLRLSTSTRRPDGDLATFDLFVDTIDLDAVPPSLIPGAGQGSTAPSQTFTSRQNGYIIRYPADWTVEAASKRWSGPRGSWKSEMADQFTGPEPPASRFTVAARAAPGGVDLDWLIRYVPRPEAAQGNSCVKGGHHMLSGPVLSNWIETTVAGRPARTRSGCGDVQAVLTVGDTAYVLSLTTPTLVGGDFAFRQIADTFRIAP